MRKILAAFLLSTALSAAAYAEVDVHSHLIPDAYRAKLAQHNALLDEGFPLPAYDAAAHIKWMDEAGIETSVLTLAAPQPYFGDSAESAQIIRACNEEAARLKREHPGRFKFCAALPLPDVEAAIAEAQYALDVLHADGIKLATNANGQYLGDPALDPLFEVLNKRQAVVILHPHRPEPINRTVMQQTPLAMQEYLSETTRAVGNMISRNVLARYPHIRVVVPHCGAYLPLAIPRMKSLAPVMQANKLVGEIDWSQNLASLYYDLAGAHSPEVIRTLLTITTPDHLLYGSDYPYASPQALSKSLNTMRDYLAKESDLAPFRKMILEQNARWLFGDASVKPQPAAVPQQALVRIAEIEVHPQYLEEYLRYAQEVAEVSLTQEAGVICLFPNQIADNPTKIRILEIYASEAAYQSHLRTEHFQKYKQGTLKMVKSLHLQEIKPLQPKKMSAVFKRVSGGSAYHK
ncbi:MAG: amidohydrolase family protein [bacterium]|nr:amidohydrolase family protein [bacterium]